MYDWCNLMFTWEPQGQPRSWSQPVIHHPRCQSRWTFHRRPFALILNPQFLHISLLWSLSLTSRCHGMYSDWYTYCLQPHQRKNAWIRSYESFKIASISWEELLLLRLSALPFYQAILSHLCPHSLALWLNRWRTWGSSYHLRQCQRLILNLHQIPSICQIVEGFK